MAPIAAAASPPASSRRNGPPETGAASTPAPSRTPSSPRVRSRSSLDSRPMAILGAKTYQNYIDGQWVDAASGETFESTSPANGDTIGVFPKSGADDVDRAVAAAKTAYVEWRLVPAPKRGEVLFRFAQLLAEYKDDVTDLMTRAMGQVRAEAAGDVQE